MHSITAGEAKGAGEAPRATDCRRGTAELTAVGRKVPMAWETGKRYGVHGNSETHRTPDLDMHIQGLFPLQLQHSKYSLQADNAPIGNLH